MPAQHRRTAGFTLIEMAIVVALFGLIVGGAVVGMGAYLEKQAIDRTTARLDKINRALTLYVITHGYLPCPTNTNGAGVDCWRPANAPDGVYVGLLPYLELGLQRVEIEDGWHNYFTYAVDVALADRDADDDDSGDQGVTPFYNGGDIAPLTDYDQSVFCARLEVQDQTGNAPDENTTICDPAGDYGLARAAYVLVSHGQNGVGAVTSLNGDTIAGAPLPDEDMNTVDSDDPTVFREAGDDILRARTVAQIIRDTQG